MSSCLKLLLRGNVRAVDLLVLLGHAQRVALAVSAPAPDMQAPRTISNGPGEGRPRRQAKANARVTGPEWVQ